MPNRTITRLLPLLLALPLVAAEKVTLQGILRTAADGTFRVECKLKRGDRTLELRFKSLREKPRDIHLTGSHTHVAITLPSRSE